MPRAAGIQVQRLCIMGTAEPHHAGFVRGFRARPVHHRRQGVGEGGDRTVSRASGCRSLHHALPVARAAAGAGAELDPAAWRDFRVAGFRSASSSWRGFLARSPRDRALERRVIWRRGTITTKRGREMGSAPEPRCSTSGARPVLRMRSRGRAVVSIKWRGPHLGGGSQAVGARS